MDLRERERERERERNLNNVVCKNIIFLNILISVLFALTTITKNVFCAY